MVDKEPKEQKQQKRFEHSQGGITTRDDANDLGVDMLPGHPDEPAGPEDALGPGPKRGDYSQSLPRQANPRSGWSGSAPMRRSEAMSRRRRVGWLPQRRTASGWSMRRGVMSAGSREAHRLVRILEQAGWSVWRTGSGHWRAEAPDGRELVIASSPGNAGFARDRLKVRRALADEDR
jgi:predicted RNA binding protein YcfA (HicA-like mRNA interferase family)